VRAAFISALINIYISFAPMGTAFSPQAVPCSSMTASYRAGQTDEIATATPVAPCAS
jgi:hypothetical protein